MFIPVILIAVGFIIDVAYIRSEYAEKMLLSTVLKGCASFMFVVLGGYMYFKMPTGIGLLIVIGLILGMIGDILLNMRFLFEGGTGNKVFAVGILAFLSGHFLYIAAIIKGAASFGLAGKTSILALILTLVLGVISIPPLMKRITAPSKALKTFGYVYLTVVIAMFCFALSLLIRVGIYAFMGIFTIGALFFVVSDFIMIYYSFGKKIKPLRAINLLTYYAGQILIALCVMYVL